MRNLARFRADAAICTFTQKCPRETLREFHQLLYPCRALIIYTKGGKPSAMAHWYCCDCKDGLTYSRGPDGVEYRGLWQCCQCGFGMNSLSIDIACSSCSTAVQFAIGQLPATSDIESRNDPFNADLGFPTSLDASSEPFSRRMFFSDNRDHTANCSCRRSDVQRPWKFTATR
jgi:hypothetical protein